MTVSYNQSGYINSSMSVRAAAAYEDGEMPKSKWTKKAMLEAIDTWCEENDRIMLVDVAKMLKNDIFYQFFEYSSWHHTSKFCNMTDFYAINETALEEASHDVPEDDTNFGVLVAQWRAEYKAKKEEEKREEQALQQRFEERRRLEQAEQCVRTQFSEHVLTIISAGEYTPLETNADSETAQAMIDHYVADKGYLPDSLEAIYQLKPELFTMRDDGYIRVDFYGYPMLYSRDELTQHRVKSTWNCGHIQVVPTVINSKYVDPAFYITVARSCYQSTETSTYDALDKAWKAIYDNEK